jgi:hypothetical protein
LEPWRDPPSSLSPSAASLPSRKRPPRARLRALDEPTPAVADWASLFGDLARPAPQGSGPAPIDWRIHDKTHLEFAIDYPLADVASEHEWEAYFFVPESFRLHQSSYDKRAIYDDLWSYVRYAVPPMPFHELGRVGPGSVLAQVRDALAASRGASDGSPEVHHATRQLRLFACLVRAAGVAAMREVDAQIERLVGGPPSADAPASESPASSSLLSMAPLTGGPGPSAGGSRAADPRGPDEPLSATVNAFVATAGLVPRAFREIFAAHLGDGYPEEVKISARWADEDISLVLETLTASLGIAIEDRLGEGFAALSEQLATCAVGEARHRQREGYDSVGIAASSERRVEHLEFRRHMLKRFTSSALWLSLEVLNGAAWIVHVLYALAAAIAMAFALFANFRSAGDPEHVLRYAVVVIIAYAIKDRLKAFLQNGLSRWASSRLPDRKWRIRDRERRHDVGRVLERAGFSPFERLPAEVLAMRRVTREHSMEEFARPEHVLWHRKTISIRQRAPSADPVAFPVMTEIFRLNIRRWLVHADDPNRKIVFADPNDALVYSATARRVYNINVVYRLRNARDRDAPWHRLRVVASRKGIERIDPIRLDGLSADRTPVSARRRPRSRCDRRRWSGCSAASRPPTRHGSPGPRRRTRPDASWSAPTRRSPPSCPRRARRLPPGSPPRSASRCPPRRPGSGPPPPATPARPSTAPACTPWVTRRRGHLRVSPHRNAPGQSAPGRRRPPARSSPAASCGRPSTSTPARPRPRSARCRPPASATRSPPTRAAGSTPTRRSTSAAPAPPPPRSRHPRRPRPRAARPAAGSRRTSLVLSRIQE